MALSDESLGLSCIGCDFTPRWDSALSTAQRIKGIEITLVLAPGMETGCVAAIP